MGGLQNTAAITPHKKEPGEVVWAPLCPTRRKPRIYSELSRKITSFRWVEKTSAWRGKILF